MGSVRDTKIDDMIAPGGRQLVLLESHGAAGRHPCVGHHLHQELQNHWELDTSTELMDPVNCGTPVANPDGYRTATEARPCIYLNQFMQIHAGTPSRDKSRFTTDFNTVQKRPRMCWARTGVRPSLLTVDKSRGMSSARSTRSTHWTPPATGRAWRGEAWLTAPPASQDSLWPVHPEATLRRSGPARSPGHAEPSRCGTMAVYCLAGTTCSQCANGDSWWIGRGDQHRGHEPCWGRGTICGAGTTCSSECCGGRYEAPRYWFGVGKLKVSLALQLRQKGTLSEDRATHPAQ